MSNTTITMPISTQVKQPIPLAETNGPTSSRCSCLACSCMPNAAATFWLSIFSPLDQVTSDLIDDSLRHLEPISKIDAGVKITKVTDELPHAVDIARVRQLLVVAGWPFDDEPLADTITPNASPEPLEDGEGPGESGDGH